MWRLNVRAIHDLVPTWKTCLWTFWFHAVLVCTAGCAPWPAYVRMALSKAGDNRGELERVLRHYERLGDQQKLEAAQYLIRNMDGHGYAVLAYYDQDRSEIDFDALDYASYKEARAVFETLEKRHGEIHYGKKSFEPDLKTMTADLLTENIELAFKAWRERPWARKLSFEAFCEYILPYRGSNEPLNSTRAACLEPFADLPTRMVDPSDPREASRLIHKGTGGWVRFNELYYLHPTDQSFQEMKESRLGRCEDITNLQMYAMRANGIAAASDYTPYWADRDNNHAWQVILDENGRGRAGLAHRAAKIYRKTFAIQPDSLGFVKHKAEDVPRWLAGRNYKDVTDQYMDPTDVTVPLTTAPPSKTRFAYLCVFNGGEWQAIHWGWVRDGQVTFTGMGRNIAYLPAYYVDEELAPAAPAFVLTAAGEIRLLKADPDAGLAIELTATTPETVSPDTGARWPQIQVKPDRTYELFFWNDGWNSLGSRRAAGEPVVFDSLPAGGLYWLVEEDSRRLERIFTIEEGRQVFW